MGVAAVVAVVMLAGNGTPSLLPADSKPTPAALQFEQAPASEPLEFHEDRRIQRLLAAMAGSFIGYAGVQGLVSLVPTGGCFPGPCPVPFSMPLVLLAPVVAGLGAWGGYSLLGGEAGLLSPLLGMFPAGLFAFVVGVLLRSNVDSSAIVPLVAGTGALLGGGMAWALDVRARQLQATASSPRADAPNGRVVFTSLISASGSIVALGTVGTLFATGCPCTAIRVAAGPVLFGLGALTTWIVHRSLHGRGSPWIAAGAAVAGALMTAIFAVAFPSPGSPAQTLVTADTLVMGATLAVFAVPLALEWSHTEAVGASRPALAFGAAPIPSGGTVTAALRF